jgi:hypothetical protein
MAAIINSGRAKIALQAGNGQPLVVTKFVFANVPGLNVSAPVDLAQGMPIPAHIVYEQAKTGQGYVSLDRVVYSVILGPAVGDFSFNWVGLVDQDNTLIAVSYTPLQYKYKTVGLTVGNTLTRNFITEYANAATVTNITVAAEAWQIDFLERLTDSDEQRRRTEEDFYGRAMFVNDGFKIVAAGSTVSVKAGHGHVAGLRVNQAADAVIATTVLPRDVYVEAYLDGDLSGANVVSVVRTSPTNVPLTDFNDVLGNTHYVVKIATVNAGYAVTDLRKTVQSSNAVLEFLLAQLALKAPSISPALTGTPTTPTAPAGNNTTQIANTAFVQAAVAALVASSPAALDTLNELAAALGNDANFATNVTNALASKAPLASPALTGTPTAPTAAAGTNTAQLATTAFVNAVRVALEQADALRAPIASPALTGAPTAPTAAAGTNTTQIANTAFVQAAVAALVASSPAALDTLNELAAALGNDANFATNVTNALASKAPLASPALTGTPTAPTAAAGTNSAQLATTAFVTAVRVALEQADALRAPLASPALTGVPTAPTAPTSTNNTQVATTAFVKAAQGYAVSEYLTDPGVDGRAMNCAITKQGNVVSGNASIQLFGTNQNLMLLPVAYRPQPGFKQRISGSWTASLEGLGEGALFEVESDGYIKFVSQIKGSGRVFINFNIIQGIV